MPRSEAVLGAIGPVYVSETGGVRSEAAPGGATGIAGPVYVAENSPSLFAPPAPNVGYAEVEWLIFLAVLVATGPP